ncbi:MAG: alpha/beta hydrolase family esterase [Candidatus Saccharibacteria bacterium]
MKHENHADYLQWLHHAEEEWFSISEEYIQYLSTLMMHRQAGREPYQLFVPQHGIGKEPRPLLVMLHGCGQDAREFVESSMMNWLADKEGFMVLYPDIKFAHHRDNNFHNGMNGWNWWYEANQERGHGETAAVADMVRDVKKTYSIDPERIYAAGISAGAAMAVNLAVAYPDLFSGIAAVAGLEYKAFSVPSGRADEAVYAMTKGGISSEKSGQLAYAEMKKSQLKLMPVIVFHGEEDCVVHRINADKLIEQWNYTNHLVLDEKSKPVLIEPDPLAGGRTRGKNFERRIYLDAQGQILMEKWYITGMDHAWPGGLRDRLFSDHDSPAASLDLWNFFMSRKINSRHKAQENR